MSSIFSPSTNNGEESLLRHVILNTIRMYNVKYREKYGRMILAIDKSSWRKKAYPEYKASRAKGRAESKIDWNAMFKTLDKIRDEINENLPYPVIHVDGAEADDVIAVLVESTQEFGQSEPVMIVSADKDFVQLQRYANVEQFSPMTKKKIVDKNPTKHLFEHILRGDGCDGVPNVLSPDDVFLTDARQKPLRKTVIEKWYTEFKKGRGMSDILDAETFKKYKRNKEMIDLSEIPTEVIDRINAAYADNPVKSNNKIFNYLVKNRCGMLIPSVKDFFITKQ